MKTKPKTTGSQMKAIKMAFCNGAKLSPKNSLKLVGCMRLGARIWDLKKEGYFFKEENKKIKTIFGTDCIYKEFSLDFDNTPKELIGPYQMKIDEGKLTEFKTTLFD